MSGKKSPIKPGVRQAQITELVLKRGFVTVEELGRLYQTSAETIRRDLGVLADKGRLRKIHGGARSIEPREEALFEERMTQNASAKRSIAEKAARHIKSRQTLFMDTGTTTLICAEVLSKTRELTVITNSLRIAHSFAGGTGAARVLLLGGEYSLDNSQTVGPATVNEIANFQADQAILTVGAISVQGGMDYSIEEAQVARAMVAASSKVTVLVDHTKFNKSATFRVCKLDRIDHLIVDQAPEGQLAAALAAHKVEII